MKVLTFRNVAHSHFLMITVLALALALGISVSTPGVALAVGLGTALLVIAFISAEAALYILIASMILSPEIIVGEIGGRAALERGITLRLDDFLVVMIGLGWLAKTAVYKELGLFLHTPLNRPILFYMLACIFSTFVGILFDRVDPTTGFFFVLKFFEFFFVYFMVVNTITHQTQIKRLVLVTLVTCFLVNLYAIAQIPGGGRVTGPFEGEAGEPNTLGGYLVFMLSIMAGLIFHFHSRRGQLLLMGLAGMTLASLLATQSRASYIALLLIFVAFLVLTLWIHRNLWVFGGLGALLLISPFILPSTVRERIEVTFSQPAAVGQIEILNVRLDTSTSARIQSWQDAFNEFREHPIFGYGVTGYRFIDAQLPRVLSETGLVGLFAFLFLLYRIGRHGIQVYRRMTDPYEKGLALGFMVGFLGLLVHSLGANTFIIVRIMEPFWLIAGLVMVLPILKPEEAKVVDETW
jgi:O-antigen ligase